VACICAGRSERATFEWFDVCAWRGNPRVCVCVCGEGDDLRSAQRLTSAGPRTSTAAVAADTMTSTHALSILKERAAPWSFAYSWIDLHFRLDCRRPYTQRIFTAHYTQPLHSMATAQT
jgi:hypothetical protein